MTFTRRIPTIKPAETFDRRVTPAQNLTYGIPIDSVPSYKYKFGQFCITPTYIMKVAQYLVWPTRQYLIIPILIIFPRQIEHSDYLAENSKSFKK
jgi:hypothetical protein